MRLQFPKEENIMKRKSMIAIIMSFAFVSMAIGVIATDTLPITGNGTGTATVTNSGPSLTGTAINDGGGWITNLGVLTEYYFYVNVTDLNTLDDIKAVTLELWVSGQQAADDPLYRYKFRYDETDNGDGGFAGTWSQTMPTAGSYLTQLACSTPALTTATSGSYVFAVSLYTIAKAGSWNYNATTTDNASVKATALTKTFSVYKYMLMTYDTGGGSQNFAWTGALGAQNVVDTFDVTVTSNTAYTMSAAYENRFYNASTGTTWSNEPSLEVKFELNPIVTVLNSTTLGFTPWRTFIITGGVIDMTTTHNLYLDFESALPSLTYTGVTIYIRATV